MRYAAISAVVFASAMFMVPGTQATAQNSNSILKVTSATSTQKIDLSPLTLLPRAKTANVTKAVHVTAPAPASAAQPAPVTVQAVAVAPGDNLSTIAAAHQESAQRLYDANEWLENPDLLEPGQTLRIPAGDEQLATRPMPPLIQTPVARVAAPAAYAAPAAADGSVWDSLASCESGGNWAINTGNGFYGGLQFTLATWQSLGGSGLPSQASRDEQIARASALQARSGWGQWPACSSKLGLL